MAAGALVGVCALLWVDALAGGDLAGGVPALLVVLGLALAAGLAGRPWQLLAAGATSATLLAVADQVHAADRFSIASDGVFYAVVVGGPLLAGAVIGGRNRQVAALVAKREELERRRDVLVRGAVIHEQDGVRRRIDRALAGRLASIADQSRALSTADPAHVPVGLAGMETTARDALSDLREILGVLRGPVLAGPQPVSVEVGAGGLTVPAPVASVRAFSADRSWISSLLDIVLLVAAVPLAVETAWSGHRGWWWANAVLALAQGLALLLIRRRPLAGAAALMVLAITQTGFLAPLPSTVSWFLPGLLGAFLVGLRDRRSIARFGLAVLLAGVSLMTLAAPAGSRALSSLIPGLVMGVLAWLAGRLAAARGRRVHELAAIADELERSSGQVAELCAAEERAQLARELHDVGAHALTVICLQAGAARAWWDRDRLRAEPALASVLDTASGPIAELSASLNLLIGEGSNSGERIDSEALEALAGLSRALGLRVDVTVSGSLRAVRSDTARVAYRIVQESLTNAARHAGRTHVQLDVHITDDALQVSVIDAGRRPDLDGLALPVNGAGLGLRGMRERVLAVDGDLFAGPLGDGFRVLARLPT